MRILFVHHCDRSSSAGGAGQVLRLIDALRERGHEIDSIFSDDVPTYLPSRRHIDFPVAVLPQVMKQNKLKRYDIIDMGGPSGWLYGLMRRFAPSLGKPRFIKRTQGLEMAFWEQYLEEERRRHATVTCREKITKELILHTELKMAIRTCDHVVANGGPDKDYIVEHGWAQPGKISVVPPGVTRDYFQPYQDSRGKGLLFVSSWILRKGIFYLREVFLMLLKEYPWLELSIIGSGASEEEVLSFFPAHARENIRVVPCMPWNEVITEYATHDVLLFPTLYEGFSSVFIEAMACGLPVVASAIDGMVDTIEDGVDGFLVAPRDSEAMVDTVARLMEDAALRKRIGLRAREKAKDYTWEKAAERTEAVYEKVLAKAR